jgi:formylglycine-generating enzyme required for sulfatase activity
LFLIPSFAWAEDKRPKPGEEREFEIAVGVKIMFCWIPPGKATLGSPRSEKGRYEAEKEHAFETTGFWLGMYPVTQKEYQAVMGENPSWFCATGDCKDDVKGMDTSCFPVENVRGSKCEEFLKKCQLKGLRLPLEDEWEYACRGGLGNRQPFYWGETLNGDRANCRGTGSYGTVTNGPFLKRTSEVGSYRKVAPHPWGLCDMHGNVWERCHDGVFRGGSWESSAGACRAACRLRWDAPYSPDNHGGFRLRFVQD